MPSLSVSVRCILDIALLRRGPQDLPFSWNLTLLAMAASIATTVAADLIQPLPGATAAHVLVTLLYTWAFFYGVLQMRGLETRLVQTLAAVFGTDAIITLVALPLLHTMTATTGTPAIAALAILFIYGWNIAVVAHILRHALSTSRGPAFLWGLGYILGMAFLGNWVAG